MIWDCHKWFILIAFLTHGSAKANIMKGTTLTKMEVSAQTEFHRQVKASIHSVHVDEKLSLCLELPKAYQGY